ncbi:MAG: prepilin-type N-terminal cleavage/methylation domain-containing protein [Pseudomonas sp.]
MKPRQRAMQPLRQPGAGALTRQRGMTLIELVISIVIIGIAAAALFSAMAAISGRSADPLLRQQSLNIAEAYMEEILLQGYTNPGAGSCSNRGCFDDVQDYNGLDDQPPENAAGDAITELAGYRVRVSVSASNLADGAATAAAYYVEVTVTDPAGEDLFLGGYRADY